MVGFCRKHLGRFASDVTSDCKEKATEISDEKGRGGCLPKPPRKFEQKIAAAYKSAAAEICGEKEIGGILSNRHRPFPREMSVAFQTIAAELVIEKDYAEVYPIRMGHFEERSQPLPCQTRPKSTSGRD